MNLEYQDAIRKIRVTSENLLDKLRILDLLEQKKTISLVNLEFVKHLNKKVYSQSSLEALIKKITGLIEDLEKNKAEAHVTTRHREALDEALVSYNEIIKSLQLFKTSDSSTENSESQAKLHKRVMLL